MNLLFINSASKIFHDEQGNQYLNPHITNNGFRQYLQFCDSFTMMIRDGGLISSEEAMRYERFNTSLGKLIVYPNIYSIKGFLNICAQIRLRKIIEEQVQWADKVICGSQGGTVIDITCKACKKNHKSYMIYCLGLVFEGQWYHSLKGKLVAFPREWSALKRTREAQYAIYVTREASQRRYPCNGKSIGCSDVEIENPSTDVLKKRLSNIKTVKDKIIFGTAAYLDVKWKGHHLMIKALSKLVNSGIDAEYHLLGSGTGINIKKMAKKYGVSDRIKFLGARPHSEVFSFYDSIDIYVQPSYQEGLCRAIVEAMSRACPVVCTDIGGNFELIEQKYLFKLGKYKELVTVIKRMLEDDNMLNAAKRNFGVSTNYTGEKLNPKRLKFIGDFINDNS